MRHILRTLFRRIAAVALLPRNDNVILSVSEISHDQSEENMPLSSSVGFFTTVQNDVILLPSREIAAVALLPRNDNVILSVSEISHRKSTI